MGNNGKIIGKISVELFINLIYDDVIEKLLSCPKFNSKEEAVKFEKEVNEIIVNKLKETKLINNLKQINDNSMNLDLFSNKAIIQERFPYEKYLEKDFPDFKYFYLLEFPTKEHFIQFFNTRRQNKDKYPILNYIVNNEDIYSKIELMQYLPLINKLCNYMINFVSFKYSREDAKKILVKDEIKDEEILNLINEFIPIYKKIRPFIKQEGCHILGDSFMEIDEKKVSLSNLCVDSGEMNFGLVLLAMYKEMETWQNSFINNVINSENIKLKNYKDLFSSKVMIQDCEKDQILNLPKFESEIILSNDKYSSLFEMIVENSFRKESEVIYNLDEIEELLASYILPRIKQFKPEYRKVVYQFECLIGDRSSLITNFRDKYQIRDLAEIELIAVVSYITKNQKQFNMKNFLFSLQVLIDIILDESSNMNESLSNIIEGRDNLPFVDLDRDFFKGVLDNIQQYEVFEDLKNKGNIGYLTVNSLINLIEIVELFCWDNIRKNLDKKYLEDINDEIKMQFDTNLIENLEDKNNNFMITRIELCSAIRKFLSRYLSGKSEEIINENNLLKSYLTKEELWPINLADVDIENELNMIFGKLEVYISQSVKLFDYLGGDMEKLEEIKNHYKKFSERFKEFKQKVNAEIKEKAEEKKDDSNDLVLEENQENGDNVLKDNVISDIEDGNINDNDEGNGEGDSNRESVNDDNDEDEVEIENNNEEEEKKGEIIDY